MAEAVLANADVPRVAIAPGLARWIALLLPPLSWFLFEQGLSAVLHADCGQSGIGIVWGLISLALCGLAARLAWPLRGPHGALANAWLARLGIVIAAIFALAIGFQLLALVIVPPCVA